MYYPLDSTLTYLAFWFSSRLQLRSFSCSVISLWGWKHEVDVSIKRDLRVLSDRKSSPSPITIYSKYYASWNFSSSMVWLTSSLILATLSRPNFILYKLHRDSSLVFGNALIKIYFLFYVLCVSRYLSKSLRSN